MQDRALCINGLAVTVGCTRRIKPAGELELGLGRDVALVLEDQDLVPEEGITDDLEFSICKSVSLLSCEDGQVQVGDTYRRGYRFGPGKGITGIVLAIYQMIWCFTYTHPMNVMSNTQCRAVTSYLTGELLNIDVVKNGAELDAGPLRMGQGLDCDGRHGAVFSLAFPLSVLSRLFADGLPGTECFNLSILRFRSGFGKCG